MLCSNESDIEREIYLFFNRLLDHGYSLTHLIPIFLTAEQNARMRREKRLSLQTNPYTPQRQEHTNDTRMITTQNSQDDKGIFLHLQYHPSNPSAPIIQKIWRRCVLTPPDSAPLYQLTNKEGHLVDIKKLTIAYSRAPNLGNLLSCRKLHAEINMDTQQR